MAAKGQPPKKKVVGKKATTPPVAGKNLATAAAVKRPAKPRKAVAQKAAPKKTKFTTTKAAAKSKKPPAKKNMKAASTPSAAAAGKKRKPAGSVPVASDSTVGVVAEAPAAYAIDGPAKPSAIVVLGPGASAGFDHPSMVDLSAALITAAAQQPQQATKLAVFRFQFPKCGFKAERLMATFHGAVAIAKSERPTAAANVFIGGRSMGGRYATHVADRVGARGVACFGYPFVPPGTPPKPPRTDHLPALRCPTIIIQGERDSFGGRAELENAGGVLRKALADSPAIGPVAWVATADHSLVPRAAGGTRASALAFAATAAWAHFAKCLKR